MRETSAFSDLSDKRDLILVQKLALTEKTRSTSVEVGLIDSRAS